MDDCIFKGSLVLAGSVIAVTNLFHGWYEGNYFVDYYHNLGIRFNLVWGKIEHRETLGSSRE